MPWLALGFRDRRKTEELLHRFSVTEIPKLVLLDGDTEKVICSNAKEHIVHENQHNDIILIFFM